MVRAPRGLMGIGEFSRRSGLSIKTLRHYHRLGILLPVYVHADSGYRYYSAHQLAEVENCRALTRVGVPLRRVRDLVRGGMTARDFRAILLEARARSGERLRAEVTRLSWLEASIASMDPTGPGGSTSVDFVAVEACRVLSVRERVADVAGGDALCDELARRWGPGDEVLREVEAATVWHDCGRSTGEVDCEAAIVPPVGDAGAASRRRGLLPGVLEATIVARVRPTGSSASTDDAYLAGWRRLASLDLSLVGPVREWVRYAGGALQVTEIHFPVARL